MYYFIVNPNAGSGRGGRFWRTLVCYLEKHQVEYEAYLTAGAGDAREISRELTEGNREPRVIIAVGGDGTMNEVLDGLFFCAPLTLGYIPAGSGNDLARSLKLSSNPVKGLKKLLAPRHYRLLDYGVISYGSQEMSHRRFLVSAGIGFDAAVCHDVLECKLKRRLGWIGLGRFAYFMAGIRQLFKSRTCKGYIVLDGVKKVEFNHIAFISCHIQPFEGGGFKLAPKADCCDGKLSVCVVSNASKRRLIPIFLESLAGRHSKHKGIRSYECGEIRIHTERPLPVHADGESCGIQTDLELECIPRKIRIVG